MSSAAPVPTASGDESPQSEDAVLARQVAEQAPYGMYVVDSQFRLKQINAEAMPVFHSVPPPMIGRDLGEAMACIWGPELGAVNTAIFRNTLASGERYLSPRYFERRHDLGVDQAFEWEVQRITLPDGRQGLVCYFADVTRRWLDQEALRISEERFRIALDISELGAWELNLADNHAWRSPRHDQVFGYPELLPTWTYEMAREHVLDEDRSAWDEGFRHAVAEKLPWNFEVRIRRADGVLRWIWAYGKYIVDADQQPVRMFGLVADITERKQAEERLRLEVVERERAEQAEQDREEQARVQREAGKRIRELEQRFRLMVDGVVDYAIFMLDAEGRVQSWNRGAERLSGYSADEIVGQHFSKFYPDEDRIAGRPEQELAGAAESGRYEEEGWRQRKDGSRFWANVTVTALRDDEGRLLGYAKISRDLSDRKRHEQQQQALTQRLSLALKISGIGVWDWHLGTNAVEWDEAMHRIYGVAPGIKADHARWRHAVLPEDLAQAEAALQQIVERRTAGSFAVRIRHPELGIRHIEIDCGVVLNADQQVERLVGVDLDVTDRLQAAEALQQTNARLESGLVRLARQNQQIKLLGELGETLQNCADMDEIRAPISSFMPALFEGYSGCIYLLHASGNYLDAVAEFGAASGSAPVFPLADCWAVRRGSIHWADARGGLRCRHLPQAGQLGITLCVPLIAQGEALGVLFMQPVVADAPAPEAEARQEIERMAAMTADRIGIAIANIRLGTMLKNQSIRDPLTGQFNRRYLEETLEREISRTRREQTSLAVLMIDVDHFKIFNDTYGHDIGDRVLHLIGLTLAQTCRTGDVVCRFGGEEFVVMMPATSLAQAAVKAEDLCEAIRRVDYGTLGIAAHPVTISIGVASFPAEAANRDDLLKTADQALYTAKKAGRDRVVCARVDSPK